MNKKGVIEQLTPIVIALVAIGIVLAVGFLIIAEVQDQIVSTDSINESDVLTGGWSAGYNATREVQSALDDIPTWLPIIIITIIGSLLIGLVAMFRRQ